MKKRIFQLISILFFLIFVCLFYTYIAYKFNIYIPCVFKKITGFYCPGCGITRCIMSILHGQFYQAFRYNPLIFLYLPFLFLYFFYNIYIYIFNQKNRIIDKVPRQVWYIFLFITILYGILRNIDSFSFLAPTTI